MGSRRIFLYVQHLLGIGHLKRALLLARALADQGLEVDLVSGGMPVPQLQGTSARVLQLPPLRSLDNRFTTLVGSDGQAVGDGWKRRRRDRLLKHFYGRRPDAIVLETFPFGRRQMHFELFPLLAAAHAVRPRPCVISSVRDILQEKRNPARIEETVTLVERWFDRVLVHGDPRLVRFEESFARADEIAEKLSYTGFIADVAEAYTTQSDAGRGEVVVSTGGGAAGKDLLDIALRARPLTRFSNVRWRLLAGSNLGGDDFAAVRRRAPIGVIVERARADFPALLANCLVSVSQGGYNTVMDILRAGARAVIVPFRGEGETEQALRAARLQQRRVLQVVQERDISPEQLARAIDAAFDAAPASAAGLDLNGAANSARLIARWLCARRGVAV